MIHPLVAWRLGAMTPFRKLFLLSDRVCPRQMTKAGRRRFRKRARRLFEVNSLADFSLQLLYISFLERFISRIFPSRSLYTIVEVPVLLVGFRNHTNLEGDLSIPTNS